MGAGLQQNEGTIWKKMTHSTPSTVFTDAAQRSAKKASIEKKRKSSDTVQQQRRLRKYSRKSQSE